MTGKKPARYYVLMTRVVPVAASSPEDACRKVDLSTPIGDAVAGSFRAVRTAAEAEYLIDNLGKVGNVVGVTA